MSAKNLFKMYKHFVAIYVKGKMAYHCALLFEMVANIILIGVYIAGFMVINSWLEPRRSFVHVHDQLAYLQPQLLFVLEADEANGRACPHGKV